MIIDGKKISEGILESVKSEILEINKKTGIFPELAVIMVGDDPASRIYVNNKKKVCNKVGIVFREYFLSESVTQNELLGLISSLNSEENVHGILVQLPLPKHIDAEIVAETIDPRKDVDCFHPFNVGKILNGSADILPCTPAGIVFALEHEKIDIASKNCVIVGRSNIVGKPLALLLLKKDATVTICHSKTKNLGKICREANILVCATGKAKLISGDMVKSGSVVIDVGINRLQDGKICGDVDFESVKNISSHITSVPGGVGPLTVSMLAKNILKCFRNCTNKFVKK